MTKGEHIVTHPSQWALRATENIPQIPNHFIMRLNNFSFFENLHNLHDRERAYQIIKCD